MACIKLELSALFVAALTLACSTASSPEGRRPPADGPVVIQVSDLGDVEFSGHAELEILPSSEPSGHRLIRLTATAISGADVVSILGTLTDAEARAFAMESAVVPSMPVMFTYPSPDIETARQREVREAQLTIEAATAEIRLSLGPITIFPPTGETPDTNPATGEVRGQVGVGCGTRDEGGNVIADPRWETDFCALAKTDLGLTDWIAASR